MASDDGNQVLLGKLYSARLETLKNMAIENDVPKNGSVEQLRARLIQELILSSWKFDWSSIQTYSKQELTQFLSVFGIKRSGSIKEQRQRLWLHLNCDVKYHSLDNLDNLSRDELHDLCLHLELPRSGSKSQLFGRVAGVLSSQGGGWGQVKRSLRRPKGGKANIKLPEIKSPKVEEVIEIKSKEEIFSEDDFEKEEIEFFRSLNSATPNKELQQLISGHIDSLEEGIPLAEAKIKFQEELGNKNLKDEFESTTGVSIGNEDQTKSNELKVEIEQFLSEITEEWSIEHETELYSHLTNLGFAVYLPEVSSELHNILDELKSNNEISGDLELKIPVETVEEAHSIANLESRNAELDNAIRDFLEDGDPNDRMDINAFIKSLELHGLRTNMPIVRQQITKRISEMQELISVEKESISSTPKNWRERQELRKLERLRPHLLDKLENIMKNNSENLVRARVDFESLASEEGLDLSISSISGRLHGLFDLHVELNAHLLREDPRTKRREKALAILNHNSVELPESGRNTLLRIEKNIEGFEQVIDVILRRNPGRFDEDQQTLLIRFLEQRGYEANQEEIRPRILGAAGMLAVDMGHISADKIPTLGPENLVAEAQVDSVVAEMRKIISDIQEERGISIKEEEKDPTIPKHHLEKIDIMRNKLNKANDILDRIGGRGI
ncbi:MAG: Uncharacterised protein [Methanobacteriota archaeon]|nr:MAG: Uncharacterised protein [Euryarchaeota archaeon]